MRALNQAGLKLIKEFEGCELKAYNDIVGVPTIGYGSTEGLTADDVDNGKTITQQEAEDLLMTDLSRFQVGVEKYVTAPINDNQFSALVAFSFNLGLGSLKNSTLLKLLNKGDISGAAEEFLRWNKAGGKVVAGLTRRRQAERSLFLQSDSLLPDGPTDKEIEDKLKDIENDV